MRDVTFEGVIIRSRDFHDYDRVVDIVTPDQTIVSAIAKGARKASSKFGGSTGKYQLVECTVYPGRTWQIIKEIVVKRTLVNIDDISYEDLRTYDSVSEIMNQLAKYDQMNGAVFALFIEFLSQSHETLQMARIWIICRIMNIQGVLPDFTTVSSSHGEVFYDITSNECLNSLQEHAHCISISIRTIKIIDYYSKKDLFTQIRGEYNLEEVQTLCEYMLQYFLA